MQDNQSFLGATYRVLKRGVKNENYPLFNILVLGCYFLLKTGFFYDRKHLNVFVFFACLQILGVLIAIIARKKKLGVRALLVNNFFMSGLSIVFLLLTSLFIIEPKAFLKLFVLLLVDCVGAVAILQPYQRAKFLILLIVSLALLNLMPA